MQLTFIEFLAEDSDSAELTGWFNISKNLEYTDPDDGHAELIGKHWEETDITYDEIKNNIDEENAARQRGGGFWAKQRPLDPDNPDDQAQHAYGDGDYERLYREGWVRFYRVSRFGMMEFTSSKETLQHSKRKIMELVKEYTPGQVLLSDAYNGSRGQPTFQKVIAGDDLRKGNLGI